VGGGGGGGEGGGGGGGRGGEEGTDTLLSGVTPAPPASRERPPLGSRRRAPCGALSTILAPGCVCGGGAFGLDAFGAHTCHMCICRFNTAFAQVNFLFLSRLLVRTSSRAGKRCLASDGEPASWGGGRDKAKRRARRLQILYECSPKGCDVPLPCPPLVSASPTCWRRLRRDRRQ